jgi:hypothetical protein
MTDRSIAGPIGVSLPAFYHLMPADGSRFTRRNHRAATAA